MMEDVGFIVREECKLGLRFEDDLAAFRNDFVLKKERPACSIARGWAAGDMCDHHEYRTANRVTTITATKLGKRRNMSEATGEMT